MGNTFRQIRVFGTKALSLPKWSAVAWVVLLASAPAYADYRVAFGDLVEISALDAPALHTQTRVDVDGKITVPLIGKLSVVGSTVDEIREHVTRLLNERASKTESSEAQRPRREIAPDEIMVTVAEYRPVYVEGQVVRAGAQAFQPGMTVRQAIVMAGGSGTPNSSGSGGIDVQSQYTGLWLDFAHEQARLWRLEQERDRLDNKFQNANLGRDLLVTPTDHGVGTGHLTAAERTATADGLSSLLTAIPVSTNVLSKISTAETDQLQLSLEAVAKERDYLQMAIEETDAQLAVLRERQGKEQTESNETGQELEGIQKLYKSGWVTLDRLAGVRRTVFEIDSRILDTTATIAQTERERREFTLRLEQLDNGHLKSIEQDIEQANINLAKIRSNLQAVGDRVIAVGDRRGVDPSPETNPTLTVSIFRDADGKSLQIEASEDTPLLPGDVIRVGRGAGDSTVPQTARLNEISVK